MTRSLHSQHQTTIPAANQSAVSVRLIFKCLTGLCQGKQSHQGNAALTLVVLNMGLPDVWGRHSLQFAESQPKKQVLCQAVGRNPWIKAVPSLGSTRRGRRKTRRGRGRWEWTTTCLSPLSSRAASPRHVTTPDLLDQSLHFYKIPKMPAHTREVGDEGGPNEAWGQQIAPQG